jgi:hypothetical protein
VTTISWEFQFPGNLIGLLVQNFIKKIQPSLLGLFKDKQNKTKICARKEMVPIINWIKNIVFVILFIYSKLHGEFLTKKKIVPPKKH